MLPQLCLAAFIGLSDDVVVRILSFGTIGLGFLLAIMAFRLLNREQSVERPRQSILTAINWFMAFSVCLCMLGLASELYRNYHGPTLAAAPSSMGTPTMNPLSPDELPSARTVAEKFLGDLDRQDFAAAYEAVPGKVRQYVTLADFKNTATQLDHMLGKMSDRRFDSAAKGMTPNPEGQQEMVYWLNFRTTYERNANAMDRVILIRNDDRVFKVVNYFKQ